MSAMSEAAPPSALSPGAVSPGAVPPSAAPRRAARSHRSTTQLAVTRTELALERSAMAAERTLMAWIRTALSMISFGFTIGKLADAIDQAKLSLMFGRTTDISGVANYLVILGTLALVIAAAQYKLEMAALVRKSLTPRSSLAFYIALFLSLLGVFVFTDLLTQL